MPSRRARRPTPRAPVVKDATRANSVHGVSPILFHMFRSILLYLLLRRRLPLLHILVRDAFVVLSSCLNLLRVDCLDLPFNLATAESATGGLLLLLLLRCCFAAFLVTSRPPKALPVKQLPVYIAAAEGATGGLLLLLLCCCFAAFLVASRPLMALPVKQLC